MTLTREQILEEMGLGPVWKLRQPPVEASAQDVAPVTGPTVPDAGPASAPEFPEEPLFVPPPEQHHLESEPPATSQDTTDDRTARIAGMDWPELHESIAACRACGLCANRQQAVPGVGDQNADWLFIGEGPGAEEDARGEPFVGQAGKLLDAMLEAIDLERGDDVYIANAVKCRPPNNRTPDAAEMATCFPYLRRQIALIQPRLLVLLGRAAVNSVLRDESSLASLRGRTLTYRDELSGGREIPVIVTYHPAYLLRNLPDKAKAWEDLCRARRLMRAAKAEG
ncbi:uracil-DNA glycosylase [Propionivibrio limicola]|uniref:uracil-DNA glycosylase n=1 Tax=Propionivibrio limicola TaxID=167645 RepID=UPI001292556E|nr:uracil-DNA glycosylase [Propionivibrio limicola]